MTNQHFFALRALDKSQSPADEQLRADLRERLIEEHQALAASVARRLMPQIGLGANDEDDLVSEAFVALIGAVDEFEPERGVPFSSFLTIRVQSRVRDYARHRASLVPHRAAERGVEVVTGADADDFAAATPDFSESWAACEGLKADIENAIRAVWRDVESGTERDRAAWERQLEALRLKFWNDASLLEISLSLNITTDAARKLIERGLCRLRPHLELELHG